MHTLLTPYLNRDPLRLGKHPGWYDHRGLIILAVGLPLVAVWPFVLVPRGLGEGRPGLVFVGVLIAGCALHLLHALCVGTLRHRFPRGLPEPRHTVLDSEPAIHIPRWGLLTHVEWPSALLFGLGFLAFARVAAYGGVVVLAVPLLLMGGWLLTLPLWVATGRFVGGGIWLTPTRVVQRWGSSWFSVDWNDIGGVSVIGPTVGLRATVAQTRHLAPTFRNHQGVPRRRLGPDGSWILMIDLRFTAVEAHRLGDTLRAYADDPGLRSEIEHPNCLDRLRNLSAHTVL